MSVQPPPELLRRIEEIPSSIRTVFDSIAANEFNKQTVTLENYKERFQIVFDATIQEINIHHPDLAEFTESMKMFNLPFRQLFILDLFNNESTKSIGEHILTELNNVAKYQHFMNQMIMKVLRHFNNYQLEAFKSQTREIVGNILQRRLNRQSEIVNGMGGFDYNMFEQEYDAILNDLSDELTK